MCVAERDNVVFELVQRNVAERQRLECARIHSPPRENHAHIIAETRHVNADHQRIAARWNKVTLYRFVNKLGADELG